MVAPPDSRTDGGRRPPSEAASTWWTCRRAAQRSLHPRRDHVRLYTGIHGARNLKGPPCPKISASDAADRNDSRPPETSPAPRLANQPALATAPKAAFAFRNLPVGRRPAGGNAKFRAAAFAVPRPGKVRGQPLRPGTRTPSGNRERTTSEPGRRGGAASPATPPPRPAAPSGARRKSRAGRTCPRRAPRARSTSEIARSFGR